MQTVRSPLACAPRPRQVLSASQQMRGSVPTQLSEAARAAIEAEEEEAAANALMAASSGLGTPRW